jgi:hypothetical protein
MNTTLSLDEKLVKNVRKIAVEKDTTLTGLIRARQGIFVLTEPSLLSRALLRTVEGFSIFCLFRYLSIFKSDT